MMGMGSHMSKARRKRLGTQAGRELSRQVKLTGDYSGPATVARMVLGKVSGRYSRTDVNGRGGHRS